MNRMMKSFLLILTLIYLSKSIRFSIVLEQRQMQCFHEQACTYFLMQKKEFDIKSTSKANPPSSDFKSINDRRFMLIRESMNSINFSLPSQTPTLG